LFSIDGLLKCYGKNSLLPEATEVNFAIQEYSHVERYILSRPIALMIRKTLLTQSEGTNLLDELLYEG
jgi:hypothetical protein